MTFQSLKVGQGDLDYDPIWHTFVLLIFYILQQLWKAPEQNTREKVCLSLEWTREWAIASESGDKWDDSCHLLQLMRAFAGWLAGRETDSNDDVTVSTVSGVVRGSTSSVATTTTDVPVTTLALPPSYESLPPLYDDKDLPKYSDVVGTQSPPPSYTYVDEQHLASDSSRTSISLSPDT